MEDIIIRGLLADSTVKIMAISGKTLVEQARETHGLSRVCTAALGRTLMMTSMMGAQLKNADERVTAMLKGGGEAGNIVCTADWTGRVKGYVENPDLELPPAPNGKLDVALAVGWFGDLTVIRDMGLKEPYVGTCPIQSGEIAEDFARYFTVSEQQPSLVYLGVRVDAEISGLPELLENSTGQELEAAKAVKPQSHAFWLLGISLGSTAAAALVTFLVVRFITWRKKRRRTRTEQGQTRRGK